ncbi:hypothetical protein [Peribacillus sp. SI8-4]|nr:hypothetical protein [Peribacillus sp. SI8-4]
MAAFTEIYFIHPQKKSSNVKTLGVILYCENLLMSAYFMVMGLSKHQD